MAGYSFLLIDEPAVLKFWTHDNIDFLSGAAWFWHNMKWARKALWVAITDSPILKKTHFNSSVLEFIWWSSLIVYEKEMIRHYLGRAIITTYLRRDFQVYYIARWVEYLPMVWETGAQSSGRVIPKTQEMLLDASWLNTQHY